MSKKEDVETKAKTKTTSKARSTSKKGKNKAKSTSKGKTINKGNGKPKKGENDVAEESVAYGAGAKTKAKYWVGVCYPENMRDDWQVEIGDIIGLPYAYCIHDKDIDSESQERKTHVHLIICFSNTTTYNHALKTFDLLSKSGFRCNNACQSVINIRNKFEYLIHNTETCKKKKAYMYSPDERITGNNFDIGAYEQVSVEDKNRMSYELCMFAKDRGFTNYTDLFEAIQNEYIVFDFTYFEILKSSTSMLQAITKANYQKATAIIDSASNHKAIEIKDKKGD